MSNVSLNQRLPATPVFEAIKKPQPKPEKKEKVEEAKAQKPDASDIIADKAYEEAIKKIEEILKPQEINVQMTYDSSSSIKNLILSDRKTGKKIAELPPEAVIEMAEKAKIENIGTLIDKKG